MLDYERILAQQPKPLRNIDRYLEEGEVALDRGKWGFAIFRTMYGGDDSDEKFARFLQVLDGEMRQSLEWLEREDLAPAMDFPVIEDRARLESATSYEVREQFARWVADRGLTLRNPLDSTRHGGGYGTAAGGSNTRYDFCLMADRRSIDSVAAPRPMGDGASQRPVTFVGVVQLGYMSEEQEHGWRGEWDDDEEDKLEAIEGNTEPDVGWYYLPLEDVVQDHDDVYGFEGRMDRARPPSVQNRSGMTRDEGEEPWRGDEAEGHSRGAAYQVERWARGKERERTGSWPGG